MKKYVLAHSQFYTRMATLYFEDIPEDRVCEQPGGQVNHPAWVIGHLASTHDFFKSLTDPKFVRDEAWREQFGGGSTPTANRADYPSKSALIERLAATSTDVVAAVEAMSEATLEGPVNDERIAGLFPTLGQFATHVLIAEKAFHVGQMSAWRRTLGFTPLFEQPERVQALVAT